jgi:hypothetical protein
MGFESGQENNLLLVSYLQTTDEAEAGRLLEELVCDFAQPLVRDIINFKLRVNFGGPDLREEALDLAGDVTLKLVKRLNELRTAPETTAIINLRSYVAAMAYNACDEYLRRRYPRRQSLRNQLRYVLTHRDEFALWQDEDGKSCCGFAEWSRNALAPASTVRKLRDSPSVIARPGEPRLEITGPPELLAAIFDCAGAPLELDDVVSVIAEVWQIKEVQMSTLEARDLQPPERSLDLDTELDQRSQLKRLWIEICQLPLRQRIALLLNLRDSRDRGVLALLPLIRLASMQQIAEVLGMATEQLASLWNQLPLGDSAIAGRLGITRQQVINLRKCARERLARRMKVSG